MGQPGLDAQGVQALEQVLGYLNFSAGATDPQFLANLNRVFAPFETRVVGPLSGSSAGSTGETPPWRRVMALLEQKLSELRGQSAAFRDATQVDAVLGLLRNVVLPGYLEYHRDLLFHQTESTLFNSLFVGRVCEAILKQGGPWDEVDRIKSKSIRMLNDYMGHRPVAALESRKIEPFPHEWLRPVPLFVRGAGVAYGPAHEVVTIALRLLEEADEPVRIAAYFDPEALEELAFDPRAYDFDHPANKRPNYHFGQWDPHRIDNRGRYRRFVVQQVTLDALMQRLHDAEGLPREELVFEAAAVLAGTVLMASGVSGSGPDVHDSGVTLSNLLPGIARYRDMFYERLIQRVTGPHAQRLRAEAAERQQPFGGARQHLNAELARRRASQLEHVHLAKIFARMGFPDAATRQAAIVPTASARMLCQIDCWLTEGRRAVRHGEVERAFELLGQILKLARRGIECGAIIDPWNILGFDAHFSLFPSADNSIHDHRADELCAMMEQVFELYSRCWSEAVVRDLEPLAQRVAKEFREVTDWWHRFATHEVSSVESVNAVQAFQGAELVAEALARWHQAGAESGNVAIWAPHADSFRSPQAYSLVLKKLIDQEDYVASMALLMHWLSQAGDVGLTSGESTFQQLAEQWLAALLQEPKGEDIPPVKKKRAKKAARVSDSPEPIDDAAQTARLVAWRQRWKTATKFFDYLEVNAEDFWRVPRFELSEGPPRNKRDPARDWQEPHEADDESNSGTYNAAYDNMVYVDSTDDGMDAPIFDTGDATHDELTREAKRLGQRLDFLTCIARLWRLAALYSVRLPAEMLEPQDVTDAVTRAGILLKWSQQAAANSETLLELLESVREFKIPLPANRHDAMHEFDQRRYAKESLMEQIVDTTNETVDARRLLLAGALAQPLPKEGGALEIRRQLDDTLESLGVDQRLTTQTLGDLFRDDVTSVRKRWPQLLQVLRAAPLLYVPLSKGGLPRLIVAARLRQRTVQDLLVCLPRRGCFVETCQLIDVAREMERSHPVGAGAVTEFDELFKVGFKTIVDSLVTCAESWTSYRTRLTYEESGTVEPGEVTDTVVGPHGEILTNPLVECLEQLTETLLRTWLSHSKTLRLSVLEKVQDKRSWKNVVKFIQQFGEDLFTQNFLNVSNIRSILHRGVDAWFSELEQGERGEFDFPLIQELDRSVPRREAIEQMTLILEAIHENYGEYRDYNSTTTQSDRGELLHSLLDFLRLRTRYDRIAWNLKPVVWAHEVLVRRGQNFAARAWRQALQDRVHDEAEQFVRSLRELQQQYAMRMPTVADRLAERFQRPLAIDRIRAMVEHAMREAEEGGPHPTFDLLEREADELTRQPSGVGLDVPPWLLALEEEVERARDPLARNEHRAALQALIQPRLLPERDMRRQITKCLDNK